MNKTTLHCEYFKNQRCQSCQWLPKSYKEQLTKKQNNLTALLQPLDLSQAQWHAPIASPIQGFRNKAKMVVSGSVERPILGILNEQNQPEELTQCPLYPQHFINIFHCIKEFIGRAGLVPYNINKKKGELKYILLTESRFNSELMLRFVLRSDTKLPLMRRELPRLLAKIPSLKVVTVNIQPKHAAILEGEQEIFLTEQQVIQERFNSIPLFIRPQGFFQTNPEVAQTLYGTAQTWIRNLPINSLWDLFCGSGGFGLHCAKTLSSHNPEISLTGIEISASAIQCASLSAQKCGLKNVNFQSLDSANFALNQNHYKPDLVIVNPPRRGIGKALSEFLNKMSSPFLLYSSCSPSTMAQDLKQLTHYQIRKIQLFDMFPHTSHYEVLVLLELKDYR